MWRRHGSPARGLAGVTLAAALVSGALFLACGGDSTSPSGENLVTVASVEVTPTTSVIAVDDTVQFTATVRDSAGTAITGHTITWSVTDTTVATVNATGRLIPKTTGTVTVRATTAGRSAETPLTIVVGPGVPVPDPGACGGNLFNLRLRVTNPAGETNEPPAQIAIWIGSPVC